MVIIIHGNNIHIAYRKESKLMLLLMLMRIHHNHHKTDKINGSCFVVFVVELHQFKIAKITVNTESRERHFYCQGDAD